MQPPITHSARNQIIFCDPASHCYRQPVGRWPSQMVKDETGSGWLNRVSTLSRSIFRLQRNEKQKRWEPNGTSRSPLSWSSWNTARVGRNRLKIFIHGQSSNEPLPNFVYYRSWRRSARFMKEHHTVGCPL